MSVPWMLKDVGSAPARGYAIRLPTGEAHFQPISCSQGGGEPGDHGLGLSELEVVALENGGQDEGRFHTGELCADAHALAQPEGKVGRLRQPLSQAIRPALGAKRVGRV